MTDTVVLNIANGNNSTRKCTVLAQDKSLINSVINVQKGNIITETDLKRLQDVARKNGDAGILEHCDLGAQEKLNLAKMNGFSEYYDISLSKDKKFFHVKVKDAATFVADPTLGTIKSDFGIRDNVLVQKGKIPYGNENVIPDSSYGAGYDNIKIKTGETINIPVAEIDIDGSPKGFLGRLWQ